MLQSRRAYSIVLALSLLDLALTAVPARAQDGILFTGAGPINRSMGGAAVAAPIDASGALFWNPATISGLPSSSMDFGVELLHPETRLSSSLAASAFGPGIPPVPLSGSTTGDNGLFALPTMALVYKPEDSSLSYGLGVFSVGGFGVNYLASGINPFAGAVNPILTPQPPNGLGLGSIYSNFQVLELTPTVSAQLSDRLSVGGGPTLALANLHADPLFITAPNADGAYPPGTHTRTAWGGGFQVGAYYKLDGGWQLGVSYRSPQWLEAFKFQTVNEIGLPRNSSFNFDVPSITSVGIGYTGIDRLTLAADFRHVEYSHTDGFEQSGFAPNGAVQGLGWRSVFAMAVGAQYQLADALAVRVGYSYNQNPISDAQSSFNVASPICVEHSLYCGATWSVTEALALSLAYAHAFENSVDGPLVTPSGTILGSSVRITTSADTFLLGATVKFGCKHDCQ